ncbi:MAG TPA: YusW family protein [Bacillota bacterium]
MKSQWKWIGVIIISVFLFVACGNNDGGNDSAENTPSTNDQQEVETNETDSITDDQTNTGAGTEAPYSFIEFDLEADYDGTEEALEVEYEYETNEPEASYKNRVQNIRLTGNEALEELDDIFSSFTFNEESPKEEVLSAVIEAFELPKDATIDLDIEFQNGTEKEYKQ